ncbi:hypothetical protein [Enterococcus sp. AZ192]|uniref:hypothetical protein n=1 Tax=unclassified Enterococcus TaxID=2608891 RepID=UPI003D28116A
MDTEEAVRLECQRSRADLEEQEDTVKFLIRNGQEYTEDIFAHTHHLLSKRGYSQEIVQDMQRALQWDEADYLEELELERRELLMQQEEVEQQYRKKRQELEE